MKKRSVMLFIALVIVVVYLVVLFGTYADGMNQIMPEATTMDETASQIGTAIGMLTMLPHLILVVLGAIFNCVGWIGKQRWAALTAAILYTVGGVLGLVNFLFLIIPMVLCYVAYGKSKPKQAE